VPVLNDGNRPASGPGRFRVALGGIHIECSTFNPAVTRAEDFRALRGEALAARYPCLAHPDFAAFRPVPLVHFRALPGGVVERGAYEAMKAELASRLEGAGPVDGLLLDVHGAMAVDGLDDAEADLAGAMRRTVGDGVPVSCSTDLHGNISCRMVETCDAITTYRTAPHTDEAQTRARALRLLLRMLAEGRRPCRVWVPIPVLVSGEMSATTAEPGASLYRAVAATATAPGIWDASLWVGYAWADQPRAGACAVVLGDDAVRSRCTAAALAQRYWDAREAFRFAVPAGPAAWCIDQGLADGGDAVFLSDAGDNPTAGGAGDVPDTLRTLIAHPALAAGRATAIYASLPAPEAVRRCRAAGPGRPVNGPPFVSPAQRAGFRALPPLSWAEGPLPRPG
jgi:microcystin degradation protein MlrC